MLSILMTAMLFAQSASAATPVSAPPTISKKPAVRRKAAIKAKAKPKVNRVEGKMVTDLPRVIEPKLSQRDPGKVMTRFKLSRDATGYTVSFVSKSAAWKLDSAKPFVMQFFAEPPAQVVPAVFFETTWPAGATRAHLKLAGVKKGAKASVSGKAVYYICHAKTKECKRVKSTF